MRARRGGTRVLGGECRLGTLHAEWTKLRTLRSTWWLLLAAVALTVAAGVVTTAALDSGDCPVPAACHEDTVELSLTGVWLGQGAVLVLAVLAMSGEYGTGTIRTTLAAQPGRVRVLAAKAVVVGALTVAAGCAGVLGSVVAGRELLAADGFAVPGLTEGATLRAGFGSVLYLALAALVGLGTAAALRDTAAATTCALFLFYALPVLSGLLADPDWRERAEELTPSTAGLAIRSTIGLDRLPIGPWAGIGVLGAHAAGALLVGALVLRSRDA
ncbi:ABC transporter permease subunit [Streptomyces luteocolor]|uniref:ABC transporter permease subunit n=1 Tax=Streptomyces luteocolor TaxID=285500 RepID=UPI000AE69221|nr:ABC transporter permease subunit [Streptomyces luteocolor]